MQQNFYEKHAYRARVQLRQRCDSNAAAQLSRLISRAKIEEEANMSQETQNID
jgi:hypothetical protein